MKSSKHYFPNSTFTYAITVPNGVIVFIFLTDINLLRFLLFKRHDIASLCSCAESAVKLQPIS